MRVIEYKSIVNLVAKLCVEANTILPDDVLYALRIATDIENEPRAISILEKCIDNAKIAKESHLPICQDTGFAVFFIEKGSDVIINGGLLYDAICDGTEIGYRDGYLRKSIVIDPLYNRQNTGNNLPPIIHFKEVLGDKLSITFAPKGGGSENMSKVAMLKPSDGEIGVIDFITKAVVESGGNPCPPTIVGVGIGGTFEYCTFLAKKALLRKIGTPNDDKKYADLETRILNQINDSGVGPQGLGGKTTALAVHIETFPCHIASMPVAVNLNCHVARHKTIIL